MEILDRYPEIKEYRDAERRVQEALKCREETLKKWGEYIKIWDSLKGEHVVEVPSRIDPRVQEFQSLAHAFLSQAYPDRKFYFSPMRPTDVLEISEKGGKEYWVSAWKFLKKPVGDEELDRMRVELAKNPEDVEKLREFLSRAYPDLEFRVDPERPGYVLLKTPRKVERKWIRVGRLIERAEVPEDLQELKEKLMKEITRMPPPPESKKYIVEISTRPEDVLRKSLYEFVDISCEKPGGHWEEGPFSDVCNYNAIGLIKDESGKTIGRIMLRWCLDENGEPDIGVEIVYPRNAKWGPKFKDALVRYLKERGFLDYKRCETPYAYKGYTDVGEKVDSRIVYHEHGTGEDYLRNRASSPDVTYAEALMISSEGDRETRRILADNPAVLRFERVVKRLLRDISDDVARTMAGTIAFSDSSDIRFSCEDFRTFNKVARPMLLDRVPEECGCEIAWELAEDSDSGVRAKLAWHIGKVPEECACEIARKLADDDNWGVRGNVARNPSGLPEECVCEIARKLADDGNSGVRNRVALNLDKLPEECACEIARKLADDDSSGVRENVATNLGYLPEECACELARKLADDDRWEIRARIASRINMLPEECMCEVAKRILARCSHRYPYVLEEITNRLDMIPKECACEVAREMAGSVNENARALIAQHIRKVPEECRCEIARKLAEDDSIYVKDNLAERVGDLPEECACEIARKLADDRERLVRHNLSFYLFDLPKECKCEIARKLADDDNQETRANVARNLDALPEECVCELARKLADDGSGEVRGFVARNVRLLPEECKYELAEKLVEDDDEGVRSELVPYLRSLFPRERVCDIAKKFSEDDSERVRYALAINLNYVPDECKCDVAKKLADDENKETREWVANYLDKLPEECRCEIALKLAEDEEPGVKTWVSMRLDSLPEECRSQVEQMLEE